jgi:hypothetical protein
MAKSTRAIAFSILESGWKRLFGSASAEAILWMSKLLRLRRKRRISKTAGGFCGKRARNSGDFRIVFSISREVHGPVRYERTRISRTFSSRAEIWLESRPMMICAITSGLFGRYRDVVGDVEGEIEIQKRAAEMHDVFADGERREHEINSV